MKNLNTQQLNALAQDNNAFALTPVNRREQLLKSLICDPMVAAMSKDMVGWLLEVLAQERQEHAQTRQDLNDIAGERDVLRLQAPEVMPKSKAIVKQAKMIARLAEAVTDVVDLHENYTDGTQTDSDAFESLLLRLREWEEKHDALIEVARDE